MGLLSTRMRYWTPNDASPGELSLSAEIRTALGGLEARLGTSMKHCLHTRGGLE